MRAGRSTPTALACALALAAPFGRAASQQSLTVVEGTVVTPRGEAAADAVVALVPLGVSGPLAVPEFVVVDQVALRFVPRVVAIAPGTAVVFPNSDGVMHNVFSPLSIGAGFDLGTYQAGERRAHVFAESGSHVVLCHVHPEMLAYVVVVPTPYRAVADEHGRYRIDGVPHGSYRLHVWHRRGQLPQDTIVVSRAGRMGLDLQLVAPSGRGRRLGRVSR